MNPIPNVDLGRAVKSAETAFVKIAEARLTDYVRGLRVQEHNLAMKAVRLRNEADQAHASAQELTKQIEAIVAGDWSAIPAMELAEKPEGGGKG